MLPANYDFEIRQGATFQRSFVCSDDSIDLSAYSGVRVMLRRYPTGELVWNSQDNPTSLIIDEGNNAIVWNISAGETADFDFRVAGYDIELYKTQNPEIVDKVIYGKITLIKEFTYNEQSA